MALFNDGIIPIQIRDNLQIGIVHLPHDLKKQEAEKIIRIIMDHVKIEEPK